MKVIVSADGLTPDEYARSGCDEVLATSARRWNSDYGVALYQRMEEAQHAGDDRAAAVCHMLLAVMMTRPPWNRQPPPDEDDPVLVTRVLDEGALAYLRLILGQIADDEVRGRAADLLYQSSIGKGKKRDIAAATTAVRAYIAEATRQEGPDGHWSHAEQRLERAFSIAAELRQNDLKKEVASHIEAVVTAYMMLAGAQRADQDASGRPSRYPAELMVLLLRHSEGEPTQYAVIAECLAEEALAASAWELRREYLRIAAQWYARAASPARELTAQERAVESWVDEARIVF